MGDTILSTVRKAAKLAVYEEMIIRVKNHHTPPTIRPERDLVGVQFYKQVFNCLEYCSDPYQIRLIMKCLNFNMLSISSCAHSGKIKDFISRHK